MKITITGKVETFVNEGYIKVNSNRFYFRELTLPTIKHFEYEFPQADKKNYSKKVYCIECFNNNNLFEEISFGHEPDIDGIRVIYYINENSLKSL